LIEAVNMVQNQPQKGC